MYKLLKNITEELEKIAEKGLSTNNLETTYKLVCMMKDIKNLEYWDCKEEYYDAMLEGGMSDEYSQARKRDSMGRYSSRGNGRMYGGNYDNGSSYRNGRSMNYGRGGYNRDNGHNTYSDYMDSKNSYRSAKDSDCKDRMLAALEQHMTALTEELGEMSRDADCREERETIKRYMTKLQNMM